MIVAPQTKQLDCNTPGRNGPDETKQAYTPRSAEGDQREGRIGPCDHREDGGVIEPAERALPPTLAAQIVERRAAQHGHQPSGVEAEPESEQETGTG
jgi:hypothetical protein